MGVFRRLPFLMVTAWSAFAVEWKPVVPAELSLSAPRVEKTADAEALFWDVRIYDMLRSRPYFEHHVEHYIRIKIFNDRGVKDQATVHIPYDPASKQTLSDVRARTIKPDGTIRELQKDAVFDKTDVKIGNKTHRKTRSFTMPDVTVGSIIEYQWQETFSEFVPRYVRLEFQRDIPIQKVTYYVRPLSREFVTEGMRFYPFNCEPTAFQLYTEGTNQFNATSIENVPAFVEEPDAPAEPELRQWMLLYYTNEDSKDPKKYWPKLGKRLQDDFERQIKVNGDVKALAAAAVEGASSPEDKVRRMADFCRTQVKNLSYRNTGLTAEERQAFKVRDLVTSADTAKSKVGFPDDINMLFAAMARAQGFEVRAVRASSQADGIFRMDLMDPYFLKAEIVAVKLENSWKYFNVGNPYVPAGMLPWYQNEAAGLLLDDKQSDLVTLPTAPPSANTITRKAKLNLSEDGTIEGRVVVTLDGLGGAMRKSYLEDLSDAKRKEDWEESIRGRYGEVEISNLAIENVTDPNKPLSYRYDIVVRGYAERTGKRLFLHPAFFQHGQPARFVAKERKHPILFRYAFQENDNVVITLPEGYSLEKAEGVPALSFGKVGSYDHTLQLRNDGRIVISDRKFIWGENNQIYFPATAYPKLKVVWDEIHNRDGHTLAMKAN